MWEIVRAGGPLMIPLVLCSLAALTITIERFLSLRRSRILPRQLTEQVLEWAQGRKLDREHLEMLRRNSPLGAVLAAALANRHRSREVIKEAVEDTGRHVALRLERYVPTLGVIAGISPLLGLLGTVFGMIQTFTVIGERGVGDANQLAAGIAQALITTAAGLMVAIPAYFFHHFFKARVQSFVIEIEQAVMALIDVIDQPAPTPISTPRPVVRPPPR